MTQQTPELRRSHEWIYRAGVTIFLGALIGALAVYWSLRLGSPERRNKHDTAPAYRDMRSPREAYYLPFLGGFAVGAVLGLTLTRTKTSAAP